MIPLLTPGKYQIFPYSRYAGDQRVSTTSKFLLGVQSPAQAQVVRLHGEGMLASVNEVLEPSLVLSGEEGPNPGERSKNGGFIGQPESSLCSPGGKVITVTELWAGRLGKQGSLMLKN